MARHADLGIAIARRGHGVEPGDERELLLGNRHRIPALLSDRQGALLARRRGPDPPLVDPRIASRMLDGRPDPVEPRALVLLARRRERRTAELLGIKPVIDLLGRVAADR